MRHTDCSNDARNPYSYWNNPINASEIFQDILILFQTV